MTLPRKRNTREIIVCEANTPQEWLDVFDAKIYPQLWQQYFGKKAKVQQTIENLLAVFKKKSDDTPKYPYEIYHQFGANQAKSLVEFVLQDQQNRQNPEKIILLAEVMRLMMTQDAYINVRLDFDRYAQVLENLEQQQQAEIIRKILSYCDQKLRNSRVTLSYTDGYIVMKSENGGTQLISIQEV